jgi:hypothetical protein
MTHPHQAIHLGFAAPSNGVARLSVVKNHFCGATEANDLQQGYVRRGLELNR